MSSPMLKTAAAIHHSKSHIPPCPIHQCMPTLNRINDTSPMTHYTNPCHHQHHKPKDVNRNEQTRCAMQHGHIRVAAVSKNVQTIRLPATGPVPFIPPRQVITSHSGKLNSDRRNSRHPNLTSENEDLRQNSEVSASPTLKTDDSQTDRPERSAENPDSISALRPSRSDYDIPDLQSGSPDSDDGKPLLNGPQEDDLPGMAETCFASANYTSKSDNSCARRPGPQTLVEQPITKSAAQGSSSDDDVPDLQNSSSDSDNGKPLHGRFSNDSHEDDQSDTEVTCSSATNPCYCSAP